jgi:hypothetical protein
MINCGLKRQDLEVELRKEQTFGTTYVMTPYWLNHMAAFQIVQFL